MGWWVVSFEWVGGIEGIGCGGGGKVCEGVMVDNVAAYACWTGLNLTYRCSCNW